MMVAADKSIIGSAKDIPGRIISPAEWAEENAVARNECIGSEVRGPIPAVAIPGVGVKAADVRIHAGRVDVGFGDIGRTQARPAVEIVFERFPFKMLALQFACGVQTDLMFALQFDLLVMGLNRSLAVEDAKLASIGVKIIQ